MRKVLIVSPHFTPVSAADMQRARLALPWFRQYGWEPVVLSVEPDLVEAAAIDLTLEETYPHDIRIVRVRGIPHRLTRPFKIGSLWLRCSYALRRAGDNLLQAEKFDLVLFTNTEFPSFRLGPRWLRKFKVPYILDYIDPWINDYYKNTNTPPPGGKLKYALSQMRAKRYEPLVIRDAAAVIAVSSSYGPELCARYPYLDPSKTYHIPFGTEPADIDLALKNPPISPLIVSEKERINFVYTGRAATDMERSLSLLFRAFYKYKESHPHEASRMHFYFIGTDYAPRPLGKLWVMPVAEKEGIADHITEHCYRIPYFEALYYLCTADALMLAASDDPRYSASKIFPYLHAKRPLITIAHKDSLMLKLARDEGHLSSFGFPENPTYEEENKIVDKIYHDWFLSKGYAKPAPPSINQLLRSHTAERMTQKMVNIFNQALIDY